MSKQAVKERPATKVVDEKKALEIMAHLNPIQDSAMMLQIAHQAVASAAEEVYDRIAEIRCGELSVREAATFLYDQADSLEDQKLLPLPAIKEACYVYRSAAKKLSNINNEFHLV